MDKQEYVESLCTKVAWYYYFENMTQQQIADQLGITRLRVIKLLETAKTENIIQFKIRPDGQKRLDLENRLKEKFGLKDILLIPSGVLPPNERAGKAGALYLEDKLPYDGFINFGYGDTVQHVLSNLCISSDSNFSIIALTGGVSYYIRHSEFVNRGSHNDSHLYLVQAPLITATEETAQIFLHEPTIARTMNMALQAKMSVISIGSVTDKATMFTDGHIGYDDLAYLKMKGAVGDILGHYYNKYGEVIDYPLQKRMISIPLEKLSEMENVIGVSGGLIKAPAIAGALRTGCIDILISDIETAEEVERIENEL